MEGFGGPVRTDSTFGRCGVIKRADLQKFLHWEDMILLKGLIWGNFYFGKFGVSKG